MKISRRLFKRRHIINVKNCGLLFLSINFVSTPNLLSMEQDKPHSHSLFYQVISNTQIFSRVIAHLQCEQSYLNTCWAINALNRVNKDCNELLATPSIMHQIVYQLAAQAQYYDEVDFSKFLRRMKACSHPAFKLWFITRKTQREKEELLFEAARVNDVQAIQRLVTEEKVHINARDKYGKTSISIAASFGANNALTQLLAYGADINLPNKHGWTPLKKAADRGQKETVKILLDARAEINKEDNEGYTPLMNAYDKREIAKLLIDKGANVNHQAFKDGTTVLIWATIEGRLDIMQLLIDAGAKDNLCDKWGRNARSIASGARDIRLSFLLEEKFGKK